MCWLLRPVLFVPICSKYTCISEAAARLLRWSVRRQEGLWWRRYDMPQIERRPEEFISSLNSFLSPFFGLLYSYTSWCVSFSSFFIFFLFCILLLKWWIENWLKHIWLLSFGFHWIRYRDLSHATRHWVITSIYFWFVKFSSYILLILANAILSTDLKGVRCHGAHMNVLAYPTSWLLVNCCYHTKKEKWMFYYLEKIGWKQVHSEKKRWEENKIYSLASIFLKPISKAHQQ